MKILSALHVGQVESAGLVASEPFPLSRMRICESLDQDVIRNGLGIRLKFQNYAMGIADATYNYESSF